MIGHAKGIRLLTTTLLAVEELTREMKGEQCLPVSHYIEAIRYTRRIDHTYIMCVCVCLCIYST